MNTSPVHSRTAPPPTAPAGTIHPVWVRVTHWLNAIAAITMMLSGWRIYDASPIFKSFMFPPSLTLAAGWAARCNGTSPRCGCWCSTASCISRSISRAAALSASFCRCRRAQSSAISSRR